MAIKPKAKKAETEAVAEVKPVGQKTITQPVPEVTEKVEVAETSEGEVEATETEAVDEKVETTESTEEAVETPEDKVEATETTEEVEQATDEDGTGEAEESENKPAEPVQATKTKTGLVKVYNPNNAFLQQSSTGIRIRAKSVAEIADDSWLELQIRHKLLQRVK